MDCPDIWKPVPDSNGFRKQTGFPGFRGRGEPVPTVSGFWILNPVLVKIHKREVAVALSRHPQSHEGKIVVSRQISGEHPDIGKQTADHLFRRAGFKIEHGFDEPVGSIRVFSLIRIIKIICLDGGI